METNTKTNRKKIIKEKSKELILAIYLLTMEALATYALFSLFLLNENSKTSEFFRISTTSLFMMILAPTLLITACCIYFKSKNLYDYIKLDNNPEELNKNKIPEFA